MNLNDAVKQLLPHLNITPDPMAAVILPFDKSEWTALKALFDQAAADEKVAEQGLSQEEIDKLPMTLQRAVALANPRLYVVAEPNATLIVEWDAGDWTKIATAFEAANMPSPSHTSSKSHKAASY